MRDGKRNAVSNKEGKKRPVSASAVVRLVIWSVVLCILVGVFAVTMTFGRGLEHMIGVNWYDGDDYTVGNGSTKDAVTDIHIDWVAGSVTVLATDGEEIRVMEDYDGRKDADCLRWRVKNGELSVKYCRSSALGTDVDVKSKNLTVEIPQAMLERLTDLRISAVSATQYIGVSARELEIRTVSGPVDVQGDYDSVEIETVSGNVNFDGTFREGSVSGVSGNADIHLRRQANELELESVSGKIFLTLPEDTTGFCIDAEDISGKSDVRGFDLEYRGSDRWGDGSMKIGVDSARCKLTVEKEMKD